ncbi:MULTISPECIES: DUF5723 family protein [unclassified Flavobacterium]|uniref:DUF5723 family protein n=1 Tax=unclassified Flavobacterium TaxID=196869 RepID=UPI001292001D|nr:MULTISPECIES: DUF5723 family protein [unclassified Flavobacterium]MQP52778.1 hypothetical protein [Flavobacterium sp. LMO9]MQP63052.1 hypothetical protein [Flavobacterium sp. LMO6]
MKKIILSLSLLFTIYSFSQEHFSGISTSKRGGLLNAANNPAELANMNTKFEINVFNFSVAMANNKISITDLISGDNVEDKLFEGDEAVNLRFDTQFYGPSFAYKKGKWGFGINSSAYIKANVVNVDSKLGEAIKNGDLSNLFTQTNLSSNDNQRLNATTWGELSFNIARNLIDSPKHKINVGANLRLLFPGAYANFSATNLNGTLVNNFGDISLINATANVNISYAGVLANNYNDQSNYNEFFSQGINGFAADLGFNYRLKDETDANSYKLNTGLSVKNLGSMTFKSDNNLSKNYILNVSGIESLDINQFQNVESMEEIEAILNDPANASYFQSTSSSSDVTIKLPTVINAYADVRLTKKWFVTGTINQKISDDTESDFTTTQNSYSLIPRFTTKWFEAYAPIAANEISGFTSGIGFRLSGFFIGSNSAISALASNGKQADLYLGVRFGF